MYLPHGADPSQPIELFCDRHWQLAPHGQRATWLRMDEADEPARTIAWQRLRRTICEKATQPL